MVSRIRGRRLACTAIVVGALALGACGSDGGGAADAPTDGPSDTSTPGTAEIVTFDVPESTVCPEGATSTSVAVTYATRGAEEVELRVDGRPIPLADPATGTVDAAIRCDPLPHDFVLIAYDADELLTVEQRMLDTITR